jgi:tetratricopeptide (TPR) repeat protein
MTGIAGRIVAVIAVLAIAVLVVRNAAVAAFAEHSPATAAAFWPAHPATEISSAMTAIATAARHGRPVPAAVFSLMSDASAKAPLAPEPYLVRGVQAELGGDGATAQRAFEAAQWRDPRSLPAAYFLADRYFRLGDTQRGLREVAALARLSPAGIATLVPYLAEYAKSPANWPALRSLFRANPLLARPTLVALSSKIETAPAVLALANPHATTSEEPWLAPLLNTLVRAGDYDKARAIWSKTAMTRTAPGQLLYDAGFADRNAPSPFNWALTSSAVGLAERQSGGKLHVVFYGQQDGILASQLLLLRPGTYRLSLLLLGDPARARTLDWSLWCDKATAPLGSATLDAVAAHGWQVTVPADCRAQWLKLSGSSNDLPQQSDVTISALKLTKVGTGG